MIDYLSGPGLGQAHKCGEVKPQTIEHRKYHHMMLEIQVLALDRHTNVVRLNQLMRSPFSDSIFHFVDVGGIVDHRCLNFSFLKTTIWGTGATKICY
jgi:hypothetical protein